MGGKANVTVSGDLAAQLGIAGTSTSAGGIGLAKEKPQGSWLLLSRFDEGAGRGGTHACTGLLRCARGCMQ